MKQHVKDWLLDAFMDVFVVGTAVLMILSAFVQP